jgi:hypothetical protein
LRRKYFGCENKYIFCSKREKNYKGGQKQAFWAAVKFSASA